MSASDEANLYVPTAVAPVISNVRFYDTADRMLKRADIEIRDGEIVDIAPPGTLSAHEHVDGSGFVCLPGLVNACLAADIARDDEPADAAELRIGQLGDILLHAVSTGVTAVGMFGSRVQDCLAAAARVGLRASLYRTYTDLWLGPEPGPVAWNMAECP
ncbi:hypothetical protein C0Z18_00515 [Trinickia dabaoshanensis]|uniref:Amidohydrolase-related domain-containing protein n=1 Tax=Trinickia dabaoshanensis TaxID=564714 RepID=A0A2N7W2R6_9BURK|nr:hypothetical protein [Trinickia dabaoshanensis]PMS23700.1 hypothetical protein C0Z18_00515 [Trinickia dabaoshanensis]